MVAGVTYQLKLGLIRYPHLGLTRLVLMCLHYLLIVGLHDAQCHHLLSQCIAFLLLLLFLLQLILQHKISIGDNKNSNITLLTIKWSYLLMDGFILLKHINSICSIYIKKLTVFWYTKEENIQLVHKVSLKLHVSVMVLKNISSLFLIANPGGTALYLLH